MNELFTWPYIIKNNAGIELLWLKVCRAVSVVPPVVPAPPGVATSLNDAFLDKGIPLLRPKLQKFIYHHVNSERFQCTKLTSSKYYI